MITPEDVTAGSNQKYWWLCPDCNGAWEAPIYRIARSVQEGHKGCPFCVGKHSPLSIAMILSDADRFYTEKNRWPKRSDGIIQWRLPETWSRYDAALNRGNRGLILKSSLAQLLATYRGVHNPQRKRNLPPLNEAMVIADADRYFLENKRWPKYHSGVIPWRHSESWSSYNNFLRRGGRGLSGNSSLARLLEKHRKVRNHANLPKLTEQTILSDADRFHIENGRWPRYEDGSISWRIPETWGSYNAALSSGARGLHGGSSLAKLLEKHRGVRNSMNLPHMSEKQILLDADRWFLEHNAWPIRKSGSIPWRDSETWYRYDDNLKSGGRGLPGGSSLSKLLENRRGVKKWSRTSPKSLKKAA